MPECGIDTPDGTEAQVDGSVGESVMKAAAGARVDSAAKSPTQMRSRASSYDSRCTGMRWRRL